MNAHDLAWNEKYNEDEKIRFEASYDEDCEKNKY